MLKIGVTRTLLFLVILSVGILSLFPTKAGARNNEVHVVTIDGSTVNPVTAEYIARALDKAEMAEAKALIIRLDTPGGLLSSTRTIVKRLLGAQIPVVVYVSPNGARAGSAGVFISYASHILAMAPSSNIGAAHPVQMGGALPQKKEALKDFLPEGEEADETTTEDKSKPSEEAAEESGIPKLEDDADPLSSKILNDTVAFITAIARQRGRNVEWGIKSVVESDSIAAEEAVELGVADFIASDMDELMEKLDGREVLFGHRSVVLDTQNVVLVYRDMGVRERILNVLADPNIAYILMILGFYGLLYEITHPGIGVPGVMGVMFLIMALYSMQMLPTNYAGLALIVLALLLFGAEAMAPGVGLLAFGGAVSLVLGSLILFNSDNPAYRVSLPLIFGCAGTTMGITLLLVRSALQAKRASITTGAEGMVGLIGIARTNIDSGQTGQVFVHGEIWQAYSDVPIKEGNKIEVIKSYSLKLKVKPAEQGAS